MYLKCLKKLMHKYFRARYSAQGERWPHESPLAGEYDVENSPAKLVILNNRRPKVGKSYLWVFQKSIRHEGLKLFFSVKCAN